MSHSYYDDLVGSSPTPVSASEHTVERIHTDTRVNVVRIALPAGGELADNKARNPVIIQALSGSVRFRIDGEELTLRPGGWIHVSARQPHALEAREPTVLLITMLKGVGLDGE
ncbi:MAG: cupin domain-containing protein [Acidimicrobiia bacterium]